jgi:hypothetical protein
MLVLYSFIHHPKTHRAVFHFTQCGQFYKKLFIDSVMEVDGKMDAAISLLVAPGFLVGISITDVWLYSISPQL